MCCEHLPTGIASRSIPKCPSSAIVFRRLFPEKRLSPGECSIAPFSLFFRILFQPHPAFFSLIISLFSLSPTPNLNILLEHEIACKLEIEKYQLKVGQARESVQQGHVLFRIYIKIIHDG